MDWRRAAGTLGLCGECREPIGTGDVYARTRFKALRCRRCALKVEPEPPTITDDAERAMVAPQPSLDLGAVDRRQPFVSTAQLAQRAQRRISRHVQQRSKHR